MSRLAQLLRLPRQRSLPQPLSSNSWLVVGLGNPGPNYSQNRHNIGQLVVDELAREFGVGYKTHRTGAQVAEYKVGPGKIILAKSNGYMNTSGAPTSALLNFYSLPPSRLIVVHDELDLDFGDIRRKFDGGHAGHNGLRDISSKCGTGYHRVRFGIGRPSGQMPVADFVLSNFSKSEQEQLPTLIALAVELVAQTIEESRA